MDSIEGVRRRPGRPAPAAGRRARPGAGDRARHTGPTAGACASASTPPPSRAAAGRAGEQPTGDSPARPPTPRGAGARWSTRPTRSADGRCDDRLGGRGRARVRAAARPRPPTPCSARRAGRTCPSWRRWRLPGTRGPTVAPSAEQCRDHAAASGRRRAHGRRGDRPAVPGPGVRGDGRRRRLLHASAARRRRVARDHFVEQPAPWVAAASATGACATTATRTPSALAADAAPGSAPSSSSATGCRPPTDSRRGAPRRGARGSGRPGARSRCGPRAGVGAAGAVGRPAPRRWCCGGRRGQRRSSLAEHRRPGNPPSCTFVAARRRGGTG